MTFEEALPLLKDGKRITRDAWPVTSYVELSYTESFTRSFILYVKTDVISPLSTTNKKACPWTVTHEDLLATDWRELYGK